MKPSMWTSMYYKATPIEALERLAGQGWEVFELSCEHIGYLAEHGPSAVAEYAATRDRLGVSIPQCHGTILADVANLDPAVRTKDLADLHNDLDICSALGIKNMVVHPGGWANVMTRREKEQMDTLRLQSFAELAAHGEKVGVRIAIENMADGGEGVRGRRQFGGAAEDIVAFIEQVGSPALGICWDTSHANINALRQGEAIRVCGDKLIALHGSDNDGSGDQHRIPGYGSVDWEDLIGALREINFPGHFNLEIPGELRMFKTFDWMVDIRSKMALEVCRHLLS
jgi:L-ribulose-5-phosphate 3-epimerase